MKKKKNDTNLEAMKNKAIFSASEGYFDTLANRIHARVNEEKSPKLVRFSHWNLIGRVAASLLVLMGVIWLFTTNQQEVAKDTSFLSGIPDEDIITYLESRPQFHVEFWEDWENRIEWEADENALPYLDLAPDEREEWIEYLDEIG